MSIFDVVVIFTLLFIVLVFCFYSRKFTKNVADFLAANRCAGKYLLTVAGGAAGLGAITIIGLFEVYFHSGFSMVWWSQLNVIVMTFIFISGWIVYRFRQSRALTMGQFLEMRYSKRFRIYAGFLMWISGIINFGIFPAIGARFFIYFLGLPMYLNIFGLTTSSYALVMLLLISISVLITLNGGQIAVMITDFIQGMFTNIMCILLVLFLLWSVQWPRVIAALQTASIDASMLNPFQTSEAKDFNIYYALISAFTVFYTMHIWQGGQGYRVSAVSPHDSRMGNVLGIWRNLIVNLFVLVLPICAYTFLHHPDFASKAINVKEVITGITNPQIQEQVAPSLALSYLLPSGLKGGLVALMLAAFISTHTTYLHSWSSIFIQDVVMPFKKKRLANKVHMRLLRLSVIGTAVFIFFFSLLFRQTDYIFMFFKITGAIFFAGGGTVIIGGLYWKKGTTLASWVAMSIGAVLAFGCIILREVHHAYPEIFKAGTWIYWLASKNGAVLSFWVSVIAIFSYFITSLLQNNPFDLDRVFYRGKYALDKNQMSVKNKRRKWYHLGITNEFTKLDKVVYLASILWQVLSISLFIGGSIYCFLFEVKTEYWVAFWKYYIITFIVITTLTTVWLSIGGVIDLKRLFILLKITEKDENDDGMVCPENNELVCRDSNKIEIKV